MVWNGQVGTAELALLPALQVMGYDGVELPLFDPDGFPADLIRAQLSETALRCTVSTAMPPGINLIDADRRAAGVAFLRRVIEQAAVLGAQLVCGPLAAPVGERRGRGYTAAEWASCVQGLQAVGTVAADHGITLALEPLNRFETFIVNTVADGVRLLDEVDQPAVGLLLDTFHMHIEEKNSAAAIRHAARHLKHFHASENDRGIVGSGQVPWPSIFGALQDIQYNSWIVVESFGHAIPELAGAACVWRPLAPSPEQLARDSLRYLRAHPISTAQPRRK
jgi:D-psicose/D-tagatose/L-ribulose 3-epimerase